MGRFFLNARWHQSAAWFPRQERTQTEKPESRPVQRVERMKRYLLDTNTISHLIRQNPAVVRRVLSAAMPSLCISAITQGELLFGLAKRPDARRLHLAVWELLRRLDVLPWDSAVAQRYGAVRAEMEDRKSTRLNSS